MRNTAKSAMPPSTNPSTQPATPIRICMHVLNPARTDPRVMREATALVQAGFHVTIVDVEHDADRPQQEMLDGVRLNHVMMSKRLTTFYSPAHPVRWMLFKVWRIWKSTRRVVSERADAYHAHDIIALPACYLAARLRRKKLVLDAHELPLVQPHIVKRRVLHRLAVMYLRLLMRRCDATITVSPALVGIMRRLYGGPAATVVRNLPTYQPPQRSNRLRERLGLPPDTLIALYQGSLQSNRTLDIVIQAAHYLHPGQVFVFMGDGPSRDSLAALAQSEGVADRVHIIPAVPYAELLSWTASAELGLLVVKPDYSPSVKGSLPNKLFEYLMAGLPVLTSEMDAIAQVVTEYQAGAVAHDLAPEAVGRQISALLGDAEGRERMRQNALMAARRDLNWGAEQNVLVAMYARLLGSPVPVRDGADVPAIGAP